MNGETPRFNFENENETKLNLSDSSFYSLLMKSYDKQTELFKLEAKRRYSTFSHINKKNKNISHSKKKRRHEVSEPKGKFATFLVKRFKLRNDYDKQHTDEFLLSKEQAFEFPSRDDDVIR